MYPDSNVRLLPDRVARDLEAVFAQVLDLSPSCRNCKHFDPFVAAPDRGECIKRHSRAVLAKGTCGLFVRRD